MRQRHIYLNKIAWFTLLAFIVGAVIVPVVHNAFHQHGYFAAEVASDDPAVVLHIDHMPAAECLVCNTVPAVPLTKSPVVQHWLTLSNLHLAGDIGYPQIQEFSLSARAPPAA